MPAENAAPIAIVAIQNSLWPTLISFRGLLLVANGNCREDQNDAGLCSVRKPAPPASPARSACRIWWLTAALGWPFSDAGSMYGDWCINRWYGPLYCATTRAAWARRSTPRNAVAQRTNQPNTL